MPIKLHLPARHDVQTKYIELDTSRCEACWKCVEACPTHVLGKVIVFRHRHARIDNAADCNGCKKCVRVCPHEAIRYTYIPPSRQPCSVPAPQTE